MSDRRSGERRNAIERRGDGAWSAGRLRRRVFAILPKSRQVHVPHWLLLSVFALAFVYLIVNFGATPAAVPMTQSQYETGEVIVFGPSEAISSDIVRSGYGVIETMDMKDLNITVQRLRIPRGMTVPEALTDLRNRYPGLEVDTNAQLRPTDPS